MRYRVRSARHTDTGRHRSPFRGAVVAERDLDVGQFEFTGGTLEFHSHRNRGRPGLGLVNGTSLEILGGSFHYGQAGGGSPGVLHTAFWLNGEQQLLDFNIAPQAFLQTGRQSTGFNSFSIWGPQLVEPLAEELDGPLDGPLDEQPEEPLGEQLDRELADLPPPELFQEPDPDPSQSPPGPSVDEDIDFTPNPEPATLLLLGASAAVGAAYRRRRRR